MESKLGLDFKKVEYARGLAKNIADDVQAFCEQYTTVAVERTLARLMGIDGVDESDVPLPNVVVDAIKDKGVLGEGILFFIANAMIQTGLNPQQIAKNTVSNASSQIRCFPSAFIRAREIRLNRFPAI